MLLPDWMIGKLHEWTTSGSVSVRKAHAAYSFFALTFAVERIYNKIKSSWVELFNQQRQVD